MAGVSQMESWAVGGHYFSLTRLIRAVGVRVKVKDTVKQQKSLSKSHMFTNSEFLIGRIHKIIEIGRAHV